MRAHSLAVAAILLFAFAAPALAIEIVELKSGRILEANSVSVNGDKLLIDLYVPQGDSKVAFTMPIDKVVPEFVYYAWAQQIQPGDVEARVRLAAWSRRTGLFSLALRQYEEAAKSDVELKDSLPDLKTAMHQEEALWTFQEAERLLRDDEVQGARIAAERIVKDFGDTEPAGRAEELLAVIAARTQFLTEKKKQDEIARRARRHRKVVDDQLERVEKAARSELRVRFSNPADALRRLRAAAYTYRQAALTYETLMDVIEVEDLRLFVKNLVDDLGRRMIRTFTKLADLRFLTGDLAGSLDAVHEVLNLDPGNAAATKLREKILEGPSVRPVPVYYPGYFYRRRLYASPCHYPAPYGLGYGYRYRPYVAGSFTAPLCSYTGASYTSSGFGIFRLRYYYR